MGFSGLYFPIVGLNTEIYRVNFRNQSNNGKIGTRKYSVSKKRYEKKHYEGL